MSKALFATPDETVSTVRGKDWARIHPKVCPHCGDTFWSWKPLDNTTWKPYVVDQDPRIGVGMRETCGDPNCWESEQERQYQRLMDYRKTHPKVAKQEPEKASRRLG